MATLIKCWGAEGIIVNGGSIPFGQFLKAYDPDAMNGYGLAEWTRDPAEAKRFTDAAAALEEWKRTSSVRPTREDGMPNRPLTAYNITFEPAP